jgi:hypothetical protein
MFGLSVGRMKWEQKDFSAQSVSSDEPMGCLEMSRRFGDEKDLEDAEWLCLFTGPLFGLGTGRGKYMGLGPFSHFVLCGAENSGQ